MERFTAEFRAAVEGNRLVGHAAVFNQETRISDFWEQVADTFFDRALSENQDVVLQANHDGLPMARTTSGTLVLGKDSTGLTFDADLPDTSLARDVRTLARRGDLQSMSFGFTVREDDWTAREAGGQLRTLRQINRLYDVSVVTFPAYAGTDVALRNLNRPKPIPAWDEAVRIRARMRRNG